MPKQAAISSGRVQLTWSTPFDAAHWERLVAASVLGEYRLPDDTADSHLFVEVGPVLSENPADRIAFLAVGWNRSQDTLFSTLGLDPRPAGEPPQHVREASQRAGGIDGMSALLGAAATIACTMSMRLELPGHRWRCPALTACAPDLDAPFSRLASAAKREQMGYRFAEGIGGLSEVSVVYDHVAEIFVVQLLAKIAVSTAPGAWLTPEAPLASLVLDALFSVVEDP